MPKRKKYARISQMILGVKSVEKGTFMKMLKEGTRVEVLDEKCECGNQVKILDPKTNQKYCIREKFLNFC